VWLCAHHGGVGVFRYVVLMWDMQSAASSSAAQDLARRIQATSPSWRVELATDDVMVLVADASRAMRAHRLRDSMGRERAGVVLGEVFVRLRALDGDAVIPDACFGPLDTEALLASEGRVLASEYWGNFVGVLVDGRRRFVYNDPCGNLPCYFSRLSGVQLAFSCLGDCREIGLRFAVNWEFVRARAVNGFLDLDMPSFAGVSSVHRGECVEFARDGALVRRSCYWHPSSFAAASDLIEESFEAAQAMRAVVRGCVHAMAGHHSAVLAQTSGGLDSSIVLGCLSDAPNAPAITCYTGYVEGSVCDERRWARLAAARRGLRHVEVRADPRALAFRHLPNLAPSMEPASLFSHWQRGPLERGLAAGNCATATFTGEGGDSTLCSTSFVYAVDHSLRRYGLGPRTWRTAAWVATRRDRTLWDVLGKAIGRQVFGTGRADYRRRLAHVCQLASSEARCGLERDRRVSESWFSSVGTISPEIVMRLGPLAFPPVFYDLSVSAHEQSPVALSPLCSQPVFEIGARIPVDVHFDAGRSRGLARRAFVAEVPEPILRRQWKDRPLRYVAEVIYRNLDFIRSTLLEGVLVREHILDQAALELALSGGPSRSAAIGGEVMNHLDLELWIRNSA
jgi:asparagine synthase (glutamine-hydrolysing)